MKTECVECTEHTNELRKWRYLSLLSKTDAANLARFRCATPRLETVQGIYSRTTTDSCSLCGQDCIPDEYHLLLKCDAFEYAKAEFLPRELFENPSTDKYVSLMNNTDKVIIRGVARFCGYILEQLSNDRE